MRATLFLIFLMAGAPVFGQGAHYTYPFTVQCPDEIVRAGQHITITANFEGGKTGDTNSPIYNWSVSQGTIVSGQGTPSTTVEIGKTDVGTLTVTLDRNFNGAHFPGVQPSASCDVVIAPLPEPRLVDEFRTAGGNCEEGFARLDNFFTEINNNPSDEALIVFYGDLKQANAARGRAMQLRNHFRFRKFDMKRVRMIFAPARENGTTQFWLTPAGASPPEIAGSVIVPEVERPTKTTLYASEYMDGVPGCSGNIYDLAGYAEILKTDTANVARIVIGQSSQARYRTKAKEVVGELRKLGVPATKIVTVYKYVRPNKWLEFTELWVVPPKTSSSSATKISWIRTAPSKRSR